MFTFIRLTVFDKINQLNLAAEDADAGIPTNIFQTLNECIILLSQVYCIQSSSCEFEFHLVSDVDVAANALLCATQVQHLQFWAARSIISSKANYFLLDNISESAKDYISHVYKMFNICSACHTASLLHAQGNIHQTCSSVSVLAVQHLIKWLFRHQTEETPRPIG